MIDLILWSTDSTGGGLFERSKMPLNWKQAGKASRNNGIGGLKSNSVQFWPTDSIGHPTFWATKKKLPRPMVPVLLRFLRPSRCRSGRWFTWR